MLIFAFLAGCLLAMNDTHRLELKERTRNMFEFAFSNYMQHGFPADELDPINCVGKGRDLDASNWNVNDILGGFSLTLIDSLDSLAILGMQNEFEKGVKKVIDTVHFDLDVRVQVFEVTIRVLGGLLSAHLLASDDKMGYRIPWYKDELLLMAKDLGDRLMPAFDTSFGLPFPRVNLRYGVLSYEVREACVAGAGTLVLEFGTLSRLLNDSKYETAAKQALFEIWDRRSDINLVGNTMSITDKTWVNSMAGVGASSDSFYEYLLKAHILLGGDEYLDIFDSAYQAIIQFGMDGNGFIYKNVNMDSAQLVTSWIDSLAAFFPGLQVLYGDINRAIRPHLLYYTIWEKYESLPERFDYISKSPAISSYPLRPELIESTYMLFQATNNHYYLTIGEKLLNDIEKTKTTCGFVGIDDVKTKKRGDRMESFFLSETLKYLYLLFDIDNLVNTIDTNTVFTTEGHLLILPRKLTNLTGSKSIHQTCQKYSPNPFVEGIATPLSQGWIDGCKTFVGLNHGPTPGEDKITSREFDAISVMLPNRPDGREGRIVRYENALLVDSLRGLPLMILPDNGAYHAIAVDGEDSKGMTVNFFVNMPESSSLQYSALLNGSMILKAAGIGPVLHHGIEFLNAESRAFSGDELVDVEGKVALITLNELEDPKIIASLAYSAQLLGALCFIIIGFDSFNIESLDSIYENENVDAVDIPVFFTTEIILPYLNFDIVVVAKDLLGETSSKDRLVFNSKPILNLNAVDLPKSSTHPKVIYANDFRKKSGLENKFCALENTCIL